MYWATVAPEGITSMPDSPRHSVSVAAVIVDRQDRALLIRRRDNGHWEPPGGILELDEDIASGLRREVAEETGLQVEPSALTGVYKNMNRGIVALVFRCRQTGGESTTASETAEVRWATRGEVAELADPAYAVRVLDALDFATPPAIRAHDGVRLT
jgi:ADP-ribose pyrophosphatase YjhB (NUDIX family)